MTQGKSASAVPLATPHEPRAWWGWIRRKQASNPVFLRETNIYGTRWHRRIEYANQLLILAIFHAPVALHLTGQLIRQWAQGLLIETSLIPLMLGLCALVGILMLAMAPVTIYENTMRMKRTGALDDLLVTPLTEREFLEGMVTGNMLFALVFSLGFVGLFLEGLYDSHLHLCMPQIADPAGLGFALVWGAYVLALMWVFLAGAWMLALLSLWLALRFRLARIQIWLIITLGVGVVSMPTAAGLSFESVRLHPQFGPTPYDDSMYALFTGGNALLGFVFVFIGMLLQNSLRQGMFNWLRAMGSDSAPGAVENRHPSKRH